jgi:hypothetical protein
MKKYNILVLNLAGSGNSIHKCFSYDTTIEAIRMETKEQHYVFFNEQNKEFLFLPIKYTIVQLLKG